MSAERSVVHGGLGHPAEISCLIYAQPEADVVWYRNTMRLEPNERRWEQGGTRWNVLWNMFLLSRYMESRGSRHTLIIRRMAREDFANYSCYASNTLGKGRAYVTLRGTNPIIIFCKKLRVGNWDTLLLRGVLEESLKFAPSALDYNNPSTLFHICSTFQATPIPPCSAARC